MTAISCSKDESIDNSKNPYSIKRISKIELQEEGYLTIYNFKYSGEKLIKIEETISSTDISNIYNESFEYFYNQNGDTTSMSYSSGIGYEKYSYEYKYLLDNLRLGVYTRRKHNYTGGFWTDYNLVYRLSNNKIIELTTKDRNDDFITYYQYSGDKLIKSTKKLQNNEDPDYYEVVSEKNYSYSENTIKISSETSELNITLKNGKITTVKDEYGSSTYFSYNSDGMLIETKDEYVTQKIYYEKGGANLEFLKLFHFHDFELDPLFNLLYGDF
jgi:hypothetical protein